MTGRNVLLAILTTFFLVALLLIYNGFYQPRLRGSTQLPVTVEQN